jgi:hypothetical protein
MNIFSFLMIMQAIIIGLGLSELLTNFSKVLKSKTYSEIGFIVPTLSAAIFLGLLQSFWEAWSLQSHDNWSFPALVLMISGPVLFHMMAHILYPDNDETSSLTEYYFSNSKLLWVLCILTIFAGVLFRPIGLGYPLFTIENLSSLIIIAGILPLLFNKNIWLHGVVVGVILMSVILDTLFISYQIQ